MNQGESLRARMQHLEGKRVLVVGLARSGRAAARLLERRGAVVTVSDSRPPWSFAGEIPELLKARIGLEFGQHGPETALRQDLIVVSPGVPWDLPALEAARARGIPVVAEVEAASWFLPGELVGVTGSNGKTTVTSLIGRMLESSGIGTLVGGNIGVPLTSMVEGSTERSVVVAELSSFQLEGTESLHPRVAVVLNITANHLDRHATLEAYVEAKARIFRNQTGDDYAVLNADDPAVTSLLDRVRARKVFFSRTQDLPEGMLISEGKVVYRVAHLERELFSPRDVRLRGAFNLENVLAATAAASVLGADFNAIAQAVREFRGVEHRLEYVGDVLGVEFYNDSKATSVDATVKALGAFERGVHLILGGKDKGAPYAPLIALLHGRVREALLIGAAAGRIARELAGTVDLVPAGDLETATRQAFHNARPGDVVLLSPACSSYDQFQDFEERGRAFKALVESLAHEGETLRLRRSQAAFERRAPQANPAPVPSVTREQSAAPGATTPRPGSPGRDVALPLLDSTAGVERALPTRSVEPAAPAGRVEPVEIESAATGAPELIAAGASEATAAPVGPSAPRHEPGLSQPERIYVYETDAEERPPLDSAETPLDEVELIRDRAPEPAAGVAASSRVADEPLIFEVTSAAAEALGSESRDEIPGKAVPASRPPRRKKRGNTAGDEQEESEESQERFPGI